MVLAFLHASKWETRKYSRRRAILGRGFSQRVWWGMSILPPMSKHSEGCARRTEARWVAWPFWCDAGPFRIPVSIHNLSGEEIALSVETKSQTPARGRSTQMRTCSLFTLPGGRRSHVHACSWTPLPTVCEPLLLLLLFTAITS